MIFSRSFLAAAALAASGSFAQAAPAAAAPTIPTKPPGSVAILLGVDSVRRELRLTSLQRAVLSDIRDEYRYDARHVVAKEMAGKLTKAQALSDLDSLTAGSERRALRTLNASQRKRLAEIQYQIRGGYELLAPSLQQKLGIDAKQKAKIAKIWIRGEKYTSKVNTRFEQGKISHYERLLQLRENRLDRSDDFLAVLTPAQYSKFLALEGEPFPPEQE